LGVIDLLPPLAWLAILGALQMADWYTTVTILEQGGRELNPIVKRLMDALGVNAALFIKSGIAMGCGWVLLHYPPWIILLVAIYAGVVGWNLTQLRK
jgi:hypothetical protein